MINASEFKHALERVLPGDHLADAQIRQLMRSIDTDGDGVIEYAEFINKFGLALASSDGGESKQPPVAKPWMEQFLSGMGAAMQRSKRSLQDLFRKFDKDCDGLITYDELFQTLLDMQCPLTMDELQEVAKYVDRDQDGKINIDEFARGFRIATSTAAAEAADAGTGLAAAGRDSGAAPATQSWERRVKDQLLRAFYHNKSALLHVFHSYDEYSTGLISKELFVKGVDALLSVQEHVAISNESLEALSEELADADGLVDYGAFIKGFNVGRASG